MDSFHRSLKKNLPITRNKTGQRNKNNQNNLRNANESRLLKLFAPAKNAQKLYRFAFYNNQEFLVDPVNCLKSSNKNARARIKEMFLDTNTDDVEITNVTKIVNPFLYLSFLLRKCEYDTLNYDYGRSQVRKMFHDTMADNVDKIIKENFNWRFCKRYKYGKGVSFSPKSQYAQRFADDGHMFVAYVLHKYTCKGKWGMKIPPLMEDDYVHYDTTESTNDDVYVKYRDDEFYPLFLIEYDTYDETDDSEYSEDDGYNTYYNY